MLYTCSRFNTRNRALTFEIAPPTFEIALQHSISRFNTRNRASTLKIVLQHSESRFNVRNRAPNIRNRASTLEIALQHSESRNNTRNRISNTQKRASSTRKHLSSTRKHLSNTLKPQKYQILRFKLLRSLNSKRKFTHFVKIVNFAHLFKSEPHQAWAQLHPPQRRLKILLSLSKSAKYFGEAIKTCIFSATNDHRIHAVHPKATPGAGFPC